EKEEALDDLARLASFGYVLYATPGTAAALRRKNVPVRVVEKRKEAVEALLRSGEIGCVINLPTQGQDPERLGFALRRMTVEMRIPCLTSLDTVRAWLAGMEALPREAGVRVLALE
ncbi:MAG: carbamoyl-phosphate synthase large subunit, partial [Alicyclobacillaceae bacterium]|nr:carbamoyl-phosphate synthase large subunit [Alicyclobacillaceae bacterium]